MNENRDLIQFNKLSKEVFILEKNITITIITFYLYTVVNSMVSLIYLQKKKSLKFKFIFKVKSFS